MHARKGGAMMSNVGNPQVYEGQDQITSKKHQKPEELIVEEGPKYAQQLTDPKDRRSFFNLLAAEEKKLREERRREIEGHEDPRMQALRHGNEPSKGAKIDAEIEQEEMEYLERKGKA